MSRLIKVKNFPDRIFAEQARDILNNNQITCVLKSPDVGVLGAAAATVTHGVDLYVYEEDEKKVYDLLNALFNGI